MRWGWDLFSVSLKAERFATSDNKLAYRYVLTPSGLQERIRLTEKYIVVKKREYEQLSAELEKLRKQAISDN